ncbi:MAG: transglycosylase SLT domain-containing protein [Pseudomonadota bacterium]|nr:transglycosylase SLT domain-containing protein [Pseudomonadota bacterium]
MTFHAVAGRLAPVPFLIVAAVVAVLVAAPEAGAASRRDEAAAAAIAARMAAAEARYGEALVKVGNADPEGQGEADAALEDMEDAVAACVQQRGCEVSNLLATYKRLLKLEVDAEGAVIEEGEDVEDDHASPVVAAVPESGRAATLLDSDTHCFDDMVQYNPAVQAAIRRWLTDMRGQLLDTHENYQYLRAEMWPHYDRGGLPEALLFGIMAKESNGKVHATSRAGAAGPMQFMFATGKRFGLGVDATGFDTRYDPNASAEASAAYLNERMRELNGNIELALAAYNGGEGRARRVFQRHGGRGFWNAEVYNEFPPETRDYVPMVIAAAWLFLHPKQYGLDFNDIHAQPATLQLRKPASIYELAICLGNRGTRDGYLRTLRNLNPRYMADSPLPAGTSLNAGKRIAGLYERYCVQGPRADLARVLMQSDASKAVLDDRGAPAPRAVASAAGRSGVHRVERGDTLSSIARKYECSTRDLARSNKLKAPSYAIRIGQGIKLDTCK